MRVKQHADIACTVVSLICLFVWTSPTYGQQKGDIEHRNELSITLTNDNFLPPIQDYYYTNGVDITYSRILGKGFLVNKIIPETYRKTIIRFNIGQKIYTPQEIDTSNIAEFDRPYAGYLFVKTSLDTFWNKKNRLQLTLNLGIIGPASGGERLQTQWHEWFNFLQPEGWQFQIRNTPVINVGLAYQHSFMVASHVDLISNTGFRGGTAFNDLSAGAKLRLGNINSIDNSALTKSRLGTTNTGERDFQHSKKEWFFFIGFNNKLVLHNALIEGGIFNPSRNPHTEDAQPYLLTLNAGISYSLPAITWRLIMNQLTPEVVGGRQHNVVSFDMAIRF